MKTIDDTKMSPYNALVSWIASDPKRVRQVESAPIPKGFTWIQMGDRGRRLIKKRGS